MERNGKRVQLAAPVDGTPEEKSRMLEKQIRISHAFGEMYFAIYSVDLQSGHYLQVSTLDIFQEHIPPQGRNELLFDAVVKYYVADGYRESMRAFLNMDTLQERLEVPNAVSQDFFGTTQGWCRASLVVEKRDGDGRVISFLYVTQEMNEEVKSEQERIAELQRAYAQVEIANQAKTDFLFRMSHDIRTPLNAIMGFDNLLSCCADDPVKVREYAEKIRVSGNLLLSLLNEILDMTKVESGQAELNYAPFGLSVLLDELALVIRSQTERKNQTLTVERHICHDRVCGDRGRISRVLFNILGNAVKYTAEGGTIRFAVSEKEMPGQDKVQFLFTVADNGMGIAPELKERIFEEFARGADENIGEIPGTGLGLSIAKNFTDQMGGSITVESEPGEGSTFTVCLPLEAAERCCPGEIPDGGGVLPEKDVLEGLRVLVVEDNDLNMEMITELLGIEGVRCDMAYSGWQALEKMEQSPEGYYDLVIMDVRMPGLDGYETTRRIRAMDRPDAVLVPIVALTANAFAEDIACAKDAGMNAHLAKPVNMDVLRETAAAVLSGQDVWETERK